MHDKTGATTTQSAPPSTAGQTLAVLGCGQMGGALARGWMGAGVLDPARTRLYDTVTVAAQNLADQTGASVSPTAADAVDGADILLVSVKPHLVRPVLEGVRAALPSHCLVLSVAAGVRLADLQGAVHPTSPVIRVMPNTPALVGAGASAFCRGPHATDAYAATAETLFGAVGRAVEVDEGQIDAVTGLSGSGPAYFYLIIEALADGAVRAGLPRAVARTLAAQTALGAAKMVLETGQHPAALKDAVTTPGGTTITGLAVLEQAGVRGALIEAVRAAAERAREMG
jgi:pyrroline-5-carboxylate reductase